MTLRIVSKNTEFSHFIRVSLALDSYDGVAVALSLNRKLYKNYNGPAFKVRRSIDNATADIEFLGGFIDEDSLTEFVGSSDGYVVSIYDQSGNGDYASISEINQPQIIEGGNVLKRNGRIVARFDGLKNSLVSTAAHNTFSDVGFIQAFIVGTKYQGNSTGRVFFVPPAIGHGTVRYGFTFEGEKFRAGATNGVYGPSNFTYFDSSAQESNELFQVSLLSNYSESNLSMYKNGSLLKESVLKTFENTDTKDTKSIIGSGNNIDYMKGEISEIIVFTKDQKLARELIEKSQTGFYKIS